MKLTFFSTLFFFFLILLFSNCQQEQERFSIKEISSPAGESSAEPNLSVGDDGQVYVTWIEKTDNENPALKFSVRQEKNWSKPQIVAQGENWFVNWADFPSMVAFKDGSLAAHWLPMSGEGSYAYDVNLAFSPDGKNWGKAIVPHRDGTQTEHGFVSLLPWDDGQLFTVWLDGRNFAKGGNGHDGHGAPTHEMTLRFAMISKEGQLSNETVLDERICDCCPTSAVRTPNGALVVYRDRSEKEIRDISIVRYQDGVWSQPQTLYEDNWEIAGCPVNGPAIAVQGEKVAVAWFTWANEIARVKVLFSNDEGRTFGDAIVVDDGDPVGRVDTVMLPDGGVLVSWMENTGNNAELRVRSVHWDCTKDESITVIESSKERASGMPKMVIRNSEIFFAWTQTRQPSTVRTAVAKLD